MESCGCVFFFNEVLYRRTDQFAGYRRTLFGNLDSPTGVFAAASAKVVAVGAGVARGPANSARDKDFEVRFNDDLHATWPRHRSRSIRAT
jgi:hypothetical protein